MQSFNSVIKIATFLAIYFVVAVMALMAGNLATTLHAALLCLLAYLISLRVFRTSGEAVRHTGLWAPFLVAFFFYGNVYAFVQQSGVEFVYTGLETSKQYTSIAHAQSTIAFAIMCALATLNVFIQAHRRAKTSPAEHKNPTKEQTSLIILGNILLTIASAGYFSTIVDNISDQVGRVGIAQQFNLKSWVFLGWVQLLFYFGALVQVSKSPKNPRVRHRLWVATLFLALYCAMDSALGGRKIIAAALFGTIYGALRYGVPPMRKILLTVPLVLLAMSVRAVFYDKFSGEADSLASIALQLGGEFVFTFLTFPTIIASGCGFYESTVSSYLMTVLQFVPRMFWDDKPFSLAQTLSNFLYGGQEGFAIVPMAEAWCTFGSGAAFAFPLIVGWLFGVLQRISVRHPIVGFIVYAHALELNRGEVSYLVLQVVILYAIYTLGGKLTASFRIKSLRARQDLLC